MIDVYEARGVLFAVFAHRAAYVYRFTDMCRFVTTKMVSTRSREDTYPFNFFLNPTQESRYGELMHSAYNCISVVCGVECKCIDVFRVFRISFFKRQKQLYIEYFNKQKLKHI